MADVHAIQKSRNAEIRIARTEYRGRTTVDVRVWFRPAGADGDMIPSKRGVQFDRKQLPAVLAALQALQSSLDAQERGR